MAGEGFLYGEQLLGEWVPESTAALLAEAQLVEWVPTATSQIEAERVIVEWREVAVALVGSERHIVEWSPPTEAILESVRFLVEQSSSDRGVALAEAQLVEWIQGNDLWAEPAALQIEGGFAPILAIVRDEGTGEEIKELARYQLSDPQSGSDLPILFVDPDTENFEGGSLPPGGITPPPHGTGFGAEARYDEKDGSPVVGPDLVD